jgi:hypothetical protein
MSDLTQELIVMTLVKYIRDVAVITSDNPATVRAVDALWEAQKKSLATLFAAEDLQRRVKP